MKEDQEKRQLAKSVEHRFLRVLLEEYELPPKIAAAIVEEAQACFLGGGDQTRPGQVRVILADRRARPGRPVDEIPKVEVIWSIDAGQEDIEVLRRFGRRGLRQVRIQRLLSEAIEQGGVATQEDLATALHVSVRTIKRDCAELEAQGVYLPTRGYVQGVGRGQTHKARIVGEWLQGHTYDQIQLSSRHSSASIQRYVQTFVRVVHLHREGMDTDRIAQLLAIGPALVEEYLAVYKQQDSPPRRERLGEQLQRLTGTPGKAERAQKGGQ